MRCLLKDGPGWGPLEPIQRDDGVSATSGSFGGSWDVFLTREEIEE